jgi:hypothetical protein
MGIGAISARVMRPGCEVDHSPPTSAEVKKIWIYTSTLILLHGLALNYLSTGTTLRFTHWTGGWVDPRASLDDLEKIDHTGTPTPTPIRVHGVVLT